MSSSSKGGLRFVQSIGLRRLNGIMKKSERKGFKEYGRFLKRTRTKATTLQDTSQEAATGSHDSGCKPYTLHIRSWSLSIHFRKIHRLGQITSIDPRFVAHNLQQSPAIRRIPSSQRSIRVEQDLRVPVHASVELVVSSRSFVKADLV
jgi:hypothetical protein